MTMNLPGVRGLFRGRLPNVPGPLRSEGKDGETVDKRQWDAMGVDPSTTEYVLG